MDNATTFGGHADAYLSSRPTYPSELFDWIAEQAPGHLMAWEVGTGSGQAALQLAERFSRVHATDIDQAQIEQAPRHPKVEFKKAPAHTSHLSEGAVDAITVATALHWFDHDKFWKEVHRVARSGAIFCAWTYHAVQTPQDVRHALIAPLSDILEPYWSEGNRLSWRGYSKLELAMPFGEVESPDFACRLEWKPAQIAAFVRSWSAHRKACLDGHSQTLAAIEVEGLAKLEDKPWEFILPLHCLAARIR